MEEGDARGRAHTAGVADADAAEEVVDNLRERNSVWRDCRRTGRAAGTYFSAKTPQKRLLQCENAKEGHHGDWVIGSDCGEGAYLRARQDRRATSSEEHKTRSAFREKKAMIGLPPCCNGAALRPLAAPRSYQHTMGEVAGGQRSEGGSGQSCRQALIVDQQVLLSGAPS